MKLTKEQLLALIEKAESLTADEYRVVTGTIQSPYEVKSIHFRPLTGGVLQMKFLFYLEGKTPGVRISTEFPDFEGEFWGLESYEVQCLYSRCWAKMLAIENATLAKILGTTKTPQTKTPTVTDILNFIKSFQNEGTIEKFQNGGCYWFATILRGRFPGGQIVYNPIIGHFAYKINGSFFDIGGCIIFEESPYFVPWDTYELGSSHRQKVIEGCIFKTL